MRRTITTLITLSFIGIALFGFIAMGHAINHGLGGCIASLAQKAECPTEGNVLTYISFHFSIFRSFSTAILNILFFAVFYFVWIAFVVLCAKILSTILSLHFHYGDFAPRFCHLRKKLYHWISRLENSPTS